jgi:hypothetical protein
VILEVPSSAEFSNRIGSDFKRKEDFDPDQ